MEKREFHIDSVLKKEREKEISRLEKIGVIEITQTAIIIKPKYYGVQNQIILKLI